MVVKGRERSPNQVNPTSSSDLRLVQLSAPFGDMRKFSECHCTVLVEFESAKERDSLGKMGENVCA